MGSRVRVALLTTGRQDFGILRSTLLALGTDAVIEPRLWVGGMHLEAAYGATAKLIDAEGIAVSQRLQFITGLPTTDTANAVEETARAIAADAPAALMIVGDRSETIAAAVAATLTRTPLIHVHGGEETEGAIDNAFRHCITKLSQLHLVSHETHARRVRQMGENPECVVVVGAPGLDNLWRTDIPNRDALAEHLGIPLADPVVVVTIHSTTLASDPLAETRALAQAMTEVPATYVITMPNADHGGSLIRAAWAEWSRGRDRVALVDALGDRSYWGLLRLACAVVGNSSSGIIEAPAAGVASINIGDRQRGRLRGSSTVDVPPDPDKIRRVLADLVAERGRVRTADSPYPSGPAAPRIVRALHAWLPQRTMHKSFRDWS